MVSSTGVCFLFLVSFLQFCSCSRAGGVVRLNPLPSQDYIKTQKNTKKNDKTAEKKLKWQRCSKQHSKPGPRQEVPLASRANSLGPTTPWPPSTWAISPLRSPRRCCLRSFQQQGQSSPSECAGT